jgi:hypothetical protein
MNELQFSLNAEEREFLVDYLHSALKGVQVEEHRTRAPSYRELVTHQKDLIAGLLNKLEPSATYQASPTVSVE